MMHVIVNEVYQVIFLVKNPLNIVQLNAQFYLLIMREK